MLVLEGRTLPTDEVAAWVAAKAGVSEGDITFAIAPTASVAGGVQIVARVIETGLHKMDALGFDVTRVMSAMGTVPLAPVARNDLRDVGRTNDCILYGGQVRLSWTRPTRRSPDWRNAYPRRRPPITHAFLRHLRRCDNAL